MSRARLIVGLTVALFAANAASALTLQIQIGPDIATVTDNGPGDLQPQPGVISFSGSLGGSVVTVVTGMSKPQVGSATTATMDLNVFDISGQGNAIVIRLTDTGFNGPINAIGTLASVVGGTTASPATTTMQAFVDRSNTPFGVTGTTVCTAGPQTASGSPFSSTKTVSCPVSGPFSMTIVEQATIPAGGTIGFDHEVDMSLPACGSIGDYVWYDANHNGVQDAGESGINGVTLQLKQGGTVLASTVSGPNPIGGAPGYYQFAGVCAGTYTVDVDESTVPAGYTPTAVNAGGDDTTDNDSDGTGAIVVLPVNGSSDQTIDFGFESPCTGSIGNFVFNDLNHNGLQDAGEPGIDGVTVRLDPGNQTTVTGPNGYYQFSGLCAGTYTVEIVSPPPGMSPTLAGVGSDGTIDSNASPAIVVLTDDNTSDQTIDFGFYTPCTGVIGDFVWHDLNRDGIQDVGEPGIQGVKVVLYDSAHTTILATTYTDANGYYSFPGLCAGDYVVEIDSASVPAGLQPSPNGSTAADKDSNPSPSGVSLPSFDSSDLTIDFGFYAPCTGTIGDFVWNDLNANGVQDAGEPGIPGVSVELRRQSDNSLITVTTTDLSGHYVFHGLCAGGYKVVVVPPSGYTDSPVNAGGDAALDSNGNPALVTLPGDFDTDLTIDFGYWQPAALGDFVWHDVNANGVQDAGEPGIANVAVTLVTCGDMPVASTMTDANGLYLFSNLTPGCYKVQFATPGTYLSTTANAGSDDAADSDAVGGVTGSYTLAAGETNLTADAGFFLPAALGDYVWKDANSNGIQDAGEHGIGGVLVTLLKCDGTSTGITTATNASGAYLFSNLAPGCYKVQFATPAGYTATTANAGSNDAVDSDAVSGVTGSYTLASGETNLTADAGFLKAPASLGDYVWNDINGDGIQNTGEPGIKGVTVKLLRCDGSWTGVSTTTDASGHYLFTNLAPGCYKVKFTTPSGFNRSPANAGSNDAVDSDSVGGTTGSYTLDAGETDLTADAGFVVIPDKCLTTYTQGGWGSDPNGNNPGMLLKKKFAYVYPNGYVKIGGVDGGYYLKFTSADAIRQFLPQKTTPGVLKASAVDPKSTTAAGVFAGQVLALQLNLDFSVAGVLPKGLGLKKLSNGPLAGYTLFDVLALANRVIGGDLSALPHKVSVSTLNDVVDSINNSFDGGSCGCSYMH